MTLGHLIITIGIRRSFSPRLIYSKKDGESVSNRLLLISFVALLHQGRKANLILTQSS